MNEAAIYIKQINRQGGRETQVAIVGELTDSMAASIVNQLLPQIQTTQVQAKSDK